MKVLVDDESGTVLVEYALVLSLLSLGFIGGLVYVMQATAAALSVAQTELLNYGLRNGL